MQALGERAKHYLEAAFLVLRAIQGEVAFPRCPTDIYDQPAKWMAAFEFLQPYAQRELKEYMKRCQAE